MKNKLTEYPTVIEYPTVTLVRVDKRTAHHMWCKRDMILCPPKFIPKWPHEATLYCKLVEAKLVASKLKSDDPNDIYLYQFRIYTAWFWIICRSYGRHKCRYIWYYLINYN